MFKNRLSRKSRKYNQKGGGGGFIPHSNDTANVIKKLDVDVNKSIDVINTKLEQIQDSMMGKLLQMSLKSDFNLKEHNITKLTREQIKKHFYRIAVYYLKKPLNKLQCISEKFDISDSLIQNGEKEGECVPCDNDKTYVYDDDNDLNFRCHDTSTATTFFNKLSTTMQNFATSTLHTIAPRNYVKTELYTINEEKISYGYKTYTLRGNWYNNNTTFPSEFDGVGYLQGFYLYTFNEELRKELNDGFPVSKCAGIYHSNKHVITGIFNFDDDGEHFDNYIQGGLGNVFDLYIKEKTKRINTDVKYMGEWKMNDDVSGINLKKHEDNLDTAIEDFKSDEKKKDEDVKYYKEQYERNVKNSQTSYNDNIKHYTEKYNDDMAILQQKLQVLIEEDSQGIPREWEKDGRYWYETFSLFGSKKLTCKEEIRQVKQDITNTDSVFEYNKEYYEKALKKAIEKHDNTLKEKTEFPMLTFETKKKICDKLIAGIEKNIENEKNALEKRKKNNGVEYHGYGTLYNRSSASTYSGNWVNGKKHGYGYYFDTKLEYNGQWNNDVYNGKGTLQYFWSGNSEKYNNKQRMFAEIIRTPRYNKYDALRELPIERIDGTWNNSKIEGPATINYFNQESNDDTKGREKGFDVFYIDDENLKKQFKKQYYFIEEIISTEGLEVLNEYISTMLSEITKEYLAITEKIAKYTTPSIQLIRSDKIVRGIFAGFMIAILFCIIGPFAFLFAPATDRFIRNGTPGVSRPMTTKEDTARLELNAEVEKTENHLRVLQGLLSGPANDGEVKVDTKPSAGGYNRFTKINKKRRRTISKINKKGRRTISKRIYK
jgi:hypothetical protein